MQNKALNTYNPKYLFFITFLLLIATIFFCTGDIQEDALITFRTARNFALHNQLSYNLGETLPGSTSIVYGLYCGLIYKLFGFLGEKVFFFSVTILNSLFLGFGLLKFSKRFYFFNKFSIYLVLCSPAFITLMHKGMETSLIAACLLYAISILEKNIIESNFGSGFQYLIFFAIGSLRIDSLVIAFLIIFPYFIIHLISNIDTKKKFSNLNKSIHAIKLPLIFTFLGFSCNIFFNKIFFGTYIPHTAIAKKIAYDIKPDFNYFLTQIKSLYFSGALQNSFLLPVPTKYLLFLYPFILPLFCLAIFLAIKLRKLIFYKYYKIYPNWFGSYSFITLLTFALIYPLFFCISGMQIFPWYFWISSLAVQIICIIFLDSFFAKYSKNIYRIIIFSLLLLIFLAKILLSLNDGAEENFYRASIGKYISNISSSNSILMLEPAGYIPYYANIKTIDERGLTSREFTNYLANKLPKKSIVSFWMKYEPDFLVQRKHILKFKDSLNNNFSAEEILWFQNNYCLKKHFYYDSKLLAPEDKFKQLYLKLGSHEDYYLYVKKDKNFLCIDDTN